MCAGNSQGIFETLLNKQIHFHFASLATPGGGLEMVAATADKWTLLFIWAYLCKSIAHRKLPILKMIKTFQVNKFLVCSFFDFFKNWPFTAPICGTYVKRIFLSSEQYPVDWDQMWKINSESSSKIDKVHDYSKLRRNYRFIYQMCGNISFYTKNYSLFFVTKID